MALQDPQSEKLRAASSGQQKNPTVFVLPANRRGPVPEGLGVEFERGGQAVIIELEKLGFTVEFIDVNQKPWNPLAGQPSMLKAIDPLRALKILLCRPRPDVVLSYFESGALCLALLRSIGLFRVPIVIVDIGVGGGSRLRNLILRLVIPRVSAIFTLGSDQVTHIRTRYKTRALVEFIPAHVDAEFYAPQNPGQQGDYILAVGDDISRDYDTLLEAIAGLDVPLVLKTKRVAENTSRYPNLSVITKRLSDREFRDLYDRARFVVMPLHPVLTAGGVTAFLEAMAMGKPQIVSDSAGLRDYVRDGENALVVPCHDAGSLRQAILRLLGDDGFRQRLGESSRSCAQSLFSSRQFAGRLADRFLQLMKR
ncbi:MAG TPA: glycosyltransferase family 4 protein [Rhizomicrobium sp.]|nr:glycosyltransferase family 4 protein [Rhizomicrobium sp.]